MDASGKLADRAHAKIAGSQAGKPDPRGPAVSATQELDRLAYARKVMESEAAAILQASLELTGSFEHAVEALLACTGRVVVAGLGKPGFVAQKLSATLASTGTPSLYLHPAEAMHGDLGRVLPEDVLVVLSHSGETQETVALAHALRQSGIASIVALTGAKGSSLAELADEVLCIGDVTEACPLGLAPTTSSVALLAVADALAMTVLKVRGFGLEAYARLHPGGSLGRSLMQVHELMRTGDALPLVGPSSTLAEVISVMTQTPGRPGAALVTDAEGGLLGIFTDGDLRRLVEGGVIDLQRPAEALMASHPKTVAPTRLVNEAAALMREAEIDQLPVISPEGRLLGLLDVQDLLQAHFLA